MRSKADLKLQVVDATGTVITEQLVGHYLVNQPYPGGAPTARMMIHNNIMGKINTDVEKWSKKHGE